MQKKKRRQDTMEDDITYKKCIRLFPRNPSNNELLKKMEILVNIDVRKILLFILINSQN